MTAYYNEIDAYAAQWLRNLIAAGHIAPGDVDERDIRDVAPDDLVSYDQCHFFAGIGVWSHALRLAGWPDDRPVWTGSCPCQPFSAAGGRGGFLDERHLWPAFHHLVAERRPPVVFGEQVASKDGLAWLDLVQADLEGAGYACGAVDLGAAGVGAPHLRQRLWFVAERVAEPESQQSHGSGNARRGRGEPANDGANGRLADADGGQPGQAGTEWLQPGGEHRQQPQDGGAGGMAQPDQRHGGEERADAGVRGGGGPAQGLDERSGRGGAFVRGVADAERIRLDEGRAQTEGVDAGQASVESESRRSSGFASVDGGPTSPTHGFWGAADWLLCRDGRWRPVEPGTFPLVDWAPARVGRLRAYGNAIVAPAAAQVIASFLDLRP